MRFERSALALAVLMAAVAIIAATRYPADRATETPKTIADVPSRMVWGPEPLPELRGGEVESLFERPAVRSASALSAVFDGLGYDLDLLAAGRPMVPRIILASLPRDLGELRETKARKAVFFRTVLPLALQVNEEILEERRRAWRIRHDHLMVGRPRPEDDLWLAAMADKYRTRRGDIDSLLLKMDVIPPSLALAQAAEESGWGTSRFTREGNALFGQWTTSEDRGLVPLAREEDEDHRVLAFDTLLDSVRAYALNLNTHRAYGDFRARRASLRALGAPVDGYLLAGGLTRYSQRGDDYVEAIRTHIRVNNLRPFDDARLFDAPLPRRLI